ncbi:hypothetical protein [Marinobacterium litorale]|uniref:hypothetical protein n=1 Tax=Marinobacterium litorale TaxID=404770 RepID=UPI000481070B|nr:hypothetical protein [Marinobacterium litorale]
MTTGTGGNDAAKNSSDGENSSYRTMLIEVVHNLNSSFDKLVVTLSGGALAVSITFLKDVISIEQIVQPWLLLTAWGLFVFSLASILGEILFGMEAYKLALRQLDDGTIYEGRPGKLFSALSCWLQRLAIITLVSGLLLLSVFTLVNMGDSNGSRQAETEQSAAPPSPNTSTPEA